MMKRATTALSVAAIVMMSVGVFAQAKPSFAGKWARQADAAAPAGGGGRGGGRGGFGQEVTITQDANTITMEYTQGQNPVKRVFKLDGTDSTNTMSFGGNSIEQVSKATWEGSTLVIVTAGQNGQTRQALSLVNGDLVIDQTAPGRGEGAGPTTTKITYKKAM